MRASMFLANTALSVLILGGAGLVVSLQVTNPLLSDAEVTVPALLTLALVVVAVLVAVFLGTGTRHRETTYW